VQLVVAGEYPPHVLTAEGDVEVVANRTTTVEIAGLH
jgi:hypothetical protein